MFRGRPISIFLRQRACRRLGERHLVQVEILYNFVLEQITKKSHSIQVENFYLVRVGQKQ
jgi:hypothetical protein